MHNYDEIEKIYYKRKTKKYVISISLLIVIVGLIYLSKHYMHNIFNKQQSNTKIEKKEEKNINHKVINNQTKIEKNKLTLDSQIPKIDTIKQSPKIEKKEKKIEKKQEQKKTINKNKKLKIVVVQKSQKLEDLLNYYKSFKDYDTAIEIANIYYKNKDYHNSINWAKKANDLNAKDEKSWLLYAKSLIALNKKIKAKTLLKLYLEIYGPNKKISSYLRSIK